MKIRFVKIGGRIWKTVIAVFLCFLIAVIRNTGIPFYVTIAAILCIQPIPKRIVRKLHKIEKLQRLLAAYSVRCF